MSPANVPHAASLRVLGAAETARDWETVYRENVDGVYRFVYSRMGNRADAEDITSQAFLRALPHLELSADTGDIRGYLIAVARSLMADFWSAKYRIPLSRLNDALTASPPSRDGVEVSRAQHSEDRVQQLLARLPERHRAVLDLRFLHGYSVRETADSLGMSQTNVKVTQWRALRQAAVLFEEVP